MWYNLEVEKDWSKIDLYEWSFGDNREIADHLKELVLSGKKIATTGLWREGKKIPTKGEYAAIIGGDGKRVCIIRYTNTSVKPFLEVKYDFIQKEGEGDPDVETWREKHRAFFKNFSDSFNNDSRVVCEEFELVAQL